MSTETNLIPHSRQAEEAVIGAVLINPDVYVELSEFLAAEDFYLHRLRFIWQAFARLVERRVPIDILTVSESLEKQGQLEEVGGFYPENSRKWPGGSHNFLRQTLRPDPYGH